MPNTTLSLDFSIDISLNGVNIDDIRQNLQQIVQQAIENGMVTGSTDAEINDYHVNTYVSPDIDDGALDDHLADQLDIGGYLQSDALQKDIIRYGRMHPAQFLAEMGENMREREQPQPNCREKN